jgi:hypothetical protein
MTMSDHDDDNEFQLHATKKAPNKRVYIGSLPNVPDLEEKLRTLLKESAQVDEINTLTINRQGKAPHALVDCGADADKVISKLHKYKFEGKRITVQREQRKAGGIGGAGGAGAGKRKVGPKKFGGWAKPTTTAVQSSAVTSLPPVETRNPPSNIDEAAERIGEVVASEFDHAKLNGDDPLNVAIASTAAVAMLASMMNDFGIEEDPTDQEGISSHDIEPQEPEDEGDFHSRLAQPFSDLLEDFGQADPNWMKLRPDISGGETTNEENVDEEPTPNQEVVVASTPDCKLSRHGKAPIHVELFSFGYLHGAPTEIRNGWSHTNPLSPTDTRDFPTVPPYLEWRDGVSSEVRRELLNASDGAMRDTADILAKQAFDAVEAAIAAGYGYGNPLNMRVYVGSHSGRHRAVLLCEIAATSLRRLLRSNDDNRITQPVSVGPHHRQLERRIRIKSAAKKKNDLEGDW